MLKTSLTLPENVTQTSASSQICLLDPGMEDHNDRPSENLGDLIIQQAVLREIDSLFGSQNIAKLSTHAPLEETHLQMIQASSIAIVGGTNLLSSNMNHYNQWKIVLRDALRLRKRVLLLGVSWWQYQGRPNLYTLALLHLALSYKGSHSVRDNYTKKKLQSIGIRNVINTGCPTMWPLANLQPDAIPQTKATNALVMLTDYSKNIELDRKLLELATSHYETVYFWPQGAGDRDYVTSFNLPVTILERSLPALENLLKSDVSLDYIGTRLHGGIRCLLAKRRALILRIDHRATEIAQETGLPSVDRADFAFMERWIREPFVTKITVDTAAIECWRQQFRTKPA
ncbi:polysaccharide pyruvyl transferase family protein [Leptolyngbya sp. FACHB-321]|uniref:polysaccharide pyruvyl transferase family protein n=1 Tax=Leptolyngbya sp. FACHB-321 TaxID=2692807 RepID=UPI0016823905|nr:polysaccharide pyruvyl transferase family protein [Leptolyngbya sp. FACHB-321]MBD2036623.1 polysaccharide pyruvyl transferase family protein [Leptolyngbya sp. FACHB-321]